MFKRFFAIAVVFAMIFSLAVPVMANAQTIVWKDGFGFHCNNGNGKVVTGFEKAIIELERVGDTTTWNLNADNIECPECGRYDWVTFSNKNGKISGKNIQANHPIIEIGIGEDFCIEVTCKDELGWGKCPVWGDTEACVCECVCDPECKNVCPNVDDCDDLECGKECPGHDCECEYICNNTCPNNEGCDTDLGCGADFECNCVCDCISGFTKNVKIDLQGSNNGRVNITGSINGVYFEILNRSVNAQQSGTRLIGTFTAGEYEFELWATYNGNNFMTAIELILIDTGVPAGSIDINVVSLTPGNEDN